MLAQIVRYFGALPSLLMNAARMDAKLSTSPRRIAAMAVIRRVNRLWLLTESRVCVHSSWRAMPGGNGRQELLMR